MQSNRNISLIGATGFVGTAVLKELLDRRHQVTAIVRDPGKITIKSENLRVVKADATQSNELAQAVKGNDIVISAFNAGWSNPNLYNDFLQGSLAIQAGVREAGVKRYIIVGGAGSLYINGAQLVDTPNFPQEFKAGSTSARDYLDLLKSENELEWTYLSPAIEMGPGAPGKRTGTYRTGLESPVFDERGKSSISVEDLAVAVVDEAENGRHIRERFTVGY